MKNNVILAGVMAVFLLLSGCSSYCHTNCEKAAEPCQAHHDLKGEVESK